MVGTQNQDLLVMILSNIFNAVIPIPISVGGGGRLDPILGIKLGIAIALVCILILFCSVAREYIRMRKINKIYPHYFNHFWRDLIDRTCDSFIGQGMLMSLSALLFIGLVSFAFWLIL